MGENRYENGLSLEGEDAALNYSATSPEVQSMRKPIGAAVKWLTLIQRELIGRG
jgi:hypothetical protein